MNKLSQIAALCDTDDCYADWEWADLAQALTQIRRIAVS